MSALKGNPGRDLYLSRITGAAMLLFVCNGRARGGEIHNPPGLVKVNKSPGTYRLCSIDFGKATASITPKTMADIVNSPLFVVNYVSFVRGPELQACA